MVHKRNQAWSDEKGLPQFQTAKALGVPIVLGRAPDIYLYAEIRWIKAQQRARYHSLIEHRIT